MSETPMDEWLKNAKAANRQRRKDSRPKGQKCSNCQHGTGHLWSQKYFYCGLGKSTKTSNGLATTKRSDWCARWKKES